eukprot:m.296592 g.296592  ORF g.296592 m.296592 type:complete len:311 (+) comp40764_c1_seq17:319-1251(+)
MLVRRKPSGQLRICIDPKPLNKALKRSHYPSPVLDDLLPELSKARVFSVCDVKHGFWHVKLDDPSSLLTTFATPYGRYRWLRMPFGISPAPEIFQRKLHEALSGLDGIFLIADDILVAGEGDTMQEATKDHDRKLEALLQRCREKGIVLNVAKLKLRQHQVIYWGHLFTAEGIRPDPKKVTAITRMARSTDVLAVQRLIGVVGYLAKFVPSLADLCAPLRALTVKDANWKWSASQESAFQQIKEAITTAPVLRKEAYCGTVRRLFCRVRGSHNARWAPDSIRKPHPATSRTQLRTNRKGTASSSVRNEEI